MAYATLRRHLVLVCLGWIDVDAPKTTYLLRAVLFDISLLL